jgi:type IV secretory pathway TrbF-like protein
MSSHTMHTVLNRSVVAPEDATSSDVYLERVTLYQVHNRWLRTALACACVVVLILAGANYKLSKTYSTLKPLVIRVNDVGAADAVAYASMEYQPREMEVRHFLMNFVQDHYSRNRATIHDAFIRQLYFLDASHTRALTEEETKTNSIRAFLSSSDDEVDINVRNVAIEDLRSAPYKATVDFEKVYRMANDHRETHRERFVAHFTFTVMDKVPNNFVPVNPLGLVITYFREDQAF